MNMPDANNKGSLFLVCKGIGKKKSEEIHLIVFILLFFIYSTSSLGIT